MLHRTLQGGMKHPYPAKGKNRLDFGFHPRENVILPRFLPTKGKNGAILGFQQIFLSWLYFRQYSRGHSMQVMEIQRGQYGGSVFGSVAWGNARRGFTNTVASVRSYAQLYCASRGRADLQIFASRRRAVLQLFASHSRARRRGRRENAPCPAAGGLALEAGELT